MFEELPPGKDGGLEPAASEATPGPVMTLGDLFAEVNRLGGRLKRQGDSVCVVVNNPPHALPAAVIQRAV